MKNDVVHLKTMRKIYILKYVLIPISFSTNKLIVVKDNCIDDVERTIVSKWCVICLECSVCTRHNGELNFYRVRTLAPKCAFKKSTSFELFKTSEQMLKPCKRWIKCVKRFQKMLPKRSCKALVLKDVVSTSYLLYSELTIKPDFICLIFFSPPTV